MVNNSSKAGRTALWMAVGVAVIVTAGAATTPSAGEVPTVTGSKRVDRLLSQMTLEEKILLIHGQPEAKETDQGQAGYWPGLPRLGIPALRLVDGPPGVLTRVPSTAHIATMGLAATFNRKTAEDTGAVIGRDARALGQDIVLEPFINIFRDQTFGRAYNTFGEDPFLAGQIAAAQITGTQKQGVMSQAKHYIGYDVGSDVTVSPQALREIYVAPFVDAVKAGVSSIMCSYNRINGEYACGNDEAQNKILKGEAGFKGFITSDWGAVHDTLYINRGLDLEMPGGTGGGGMTSFFNAKPSEPPKAPPAGGGGNPEPFLAGSVPEEKTIERRFAPRKPASSEGMLAAVRSGAVSEATITAAVGRILYQVEHFGYLDHAPKHTVTKEDTESNAKIVRKTAEDGAVLLKNEGVLPLKAADIQTAVLIGPGAGQTIAIGASGEKALGHVERQIGTVTALEKTLNLKAGQLAFAVANDMTGTAIPAAQFSHDGQPGLLRGDAKAATGQVDAELNFAKLNGKALPPGSSHTWTGTLNVPAAGRYNLYLQVLGASGSFSIDGKRVGATAGLALHGNVLQPGQDNVIPTTDGLDNVRRALELTAGPHELRVEVRGDDSGDAVQARLAWVTPEQQRNNYAAAVNAAKAAKTAVVFVWGRGNPQFALPGDQDQLIADIVAVNPNTVVVVNSSQPFAMPWLSKVKAVVQMWYPGDEGGWATANVLLGRTSPAGRLPFTWPAKLEDNVGNDPRFPERSIAGVDGKTNYSEGILVGYRWFDSQNLQPLFPFGYGLSYSKFDYSGLGVSAAKDGGVDVSFTVRNSGAVASDEVPQIYLGTPAAPPEGAQFAPRSLVGFDRINLQAGQSKQVKLHVPLRQLQYWDSKGSSWKTAGARPIYVGASSRDIRLTSAIK